MEPEEHVESCDCTELQEKTVGRVGVGRYENFDIYKNHNSFNQKSAIKFKGAVHVGPIHDVHRVLKSCEGEFHDQEALPDRIKVPSAKLELTEALILQTYFVQLGLRHKCFPSVLLVDAPVPENGAGGEDHVVALVKQRAIEQCTRKLRVNAKVEDRQHEEHVFIEHI